MAKKRTKKRTPKKKWGGGDATGAGAGAGAPGGGVEQQPGVAPSPEEPRDDEQRDSPPCDEEQFERGEGPPEEKERLMISVYGAVVLCDGSTTSEITSSYCVSQRARAVLLSLCNSYNSGETKTRGWFGMAHRQGEHLPLALDGSDVVVNAKMKEGFERFIGASALARDPAYDEFRGMTEGILQVWDDQISDGLGFVAFIEGGWTAQERSIHAGLIMPCHPFDALVFLKENQHGGRLERGKPLTHREEVITTDILDRLNPFQADFVMTNNLLFRTLFVDYKNCSVNRFFDTPEDIARDDLKRWASLGGGHVEDDDTHIQKKDLPTGSIDLVAKVENCSQSKAVRLLKASEGDVIGALTGTLGANKERFGLAKRHFQCRARALLYAKLMIHVLESVVQKGLTAALPFKREGNDQIEQTHLFMDANETLHGCTK